MRHLVSHVARPLAAQKWKGPSAEFRYFLYLWLETYYRKVILVSLYLAYLCFLGQEFRKSMYKCCGLLDFESEGHGVASQP